MEQFNVYWGYVVAAVIAVPLRYFLSQTQACLRIGRAISDTGSKTGFQNAVTPPASVNWALLTYISVVAIIGYQGWAFGFLAAGITVAVIIAVAAIAGRTLIPKPDAMSWNLRIYASLGARVADYRRDGDQMRADAAEDLMRRIETRLLAPPNVSEGENQDDRGNPDTSDIIAAFGDVLIERSNAGIAVAVSDESSLPFPKATILAAILAELAVTDDAQRRSVLESGATELAWFQQGVGPEPIYPAGIDASRLRSSPHPMDQMKAIIGDRNHPEHEATMQWIRDEAAAVRAMGEEFTPEKKQLFKLAEAEQQKILALVRATRPASA